MAYIYSMFYFCLILQIKAIKNCPSENGFHLFGDKCDFMCHCKDNDECDVTSGDCTSGCARGWFGPGCQYRDIAAIGRTRATDGDLTTCSKTRKSWSVQFSTKELITEIHIVTQPDKLDLFKNFSVIVEDNMRIRECYRHGDEAPKTERIVVICNNHISGYRVWINLAGKETALVLCDVKINGGRNLAFKRKASQISVYPTCHATCTAEKAVDGHDNGRSLSKCSYTNSEDNPWWRVDLGYLARIRMIKIVYFSGEGPYVIEVSNNTDNDSGLTPNEVMVDVGVDVIGRFMKVTRKESNKRISLCELYVYGDCIEDMCGFGCEKTCHCQNTSIQDKMTGHCLGGCKEGLIGPQCDKQTKEERDCERGMYGRQCSKRCSVNCNGNDHRVCDGKDGKCLGGCKPGWRGEMCSRKTEKERDCDRGMYGSQCLERCSDNCNGNDHRVCDSKDGKCLGGCKAGWTGEMCNQRCTYGSYGTNCEEICNQQCKYGDQYCNRTTGHCLHGCETGWTGQLCDKDCNDGFYGNDCERCSDNCNPPQQGGYRYCRLSDGVCLNGCKPGWTGHHCENKCEVDKWGLECRNDCGKCLSSPCNHVTGVCKDGCADGYKPDTECRTECDNGYYGKNCYLRCEDGCSRSGRNAICDKENGRCLNGCNPGYKGLFCNEVCVEGVEWGPNCTYTCGHCDNSLCDRFNGICPRGCATGFKGQRCTQECGNGYYGKNCTSPCEFGCSRSGRNAICDKGNGRCLNGCNPGYKGLLCNEDCEDGKWGKDCQNICGHCLFLPCNKVDGHCTGGCVAGYKYTWTCNTECDDSRYGLKCKGRCSENCKDVCDKKTGMCSNCTSGWKGNHCSEECSPVEWGENCSHTCGKCKNDESCNRFNGTCEHGCFPGYKLTQYCNEECDEGAYGDACVGKCEYGWSGLNAVCDKGNVSCLNRCKPGYKAFVSFVTKMLGRILLIFRPG